MVSGVVGGVDTHADVHLAAVLDKNGGLLGIESFPVNEAGYCRLAEWLAGTNADHIRAHFADTHQIANPVAARVLLRFPRLGPALVQPRSGDPSILLVHPAARVMRSSS